MRWLLAILLAAPVSFTTVFAAAQSADEADEANETPERRTATPYVTQLRQGLVQLASGDTVGALTTFQEAIRSEPEQAEGHCHLASAQRKNGDAATALESFRTCARMSRQAGDPVNEARGLLGTAQILVRDTTQREPARAAVNSLLRFAETHPEIYPLDLARHLQQTLDSIIELDAVSAEVRQRREERAARPTE